MQIHDSNANPSPLYDVLYVHSKSVRLSWSDILFDFLWFLLAVSDRPLDWKHTFAIQQRECLLVLELFVNNHNTIAL